MAIAAMAVPVAAAGMVLAVAGMTLAVLTPAPLANMVAATFGADLAAAVVDIVVDAFVVGVPARVAILAADIGAFARLRVGLPAELVLRRHDDAVIVLGVLEIALRRDHVAGGERVARERHVFLGDVGRGPTDLHVGTIRFVAPR